MPRKRPLCPPAVSYITCRLRCRTSVRPTPSERKMRTQQPSEVPCRDCCRHHRHLALLALLRRCKREYRSVLRAWDNPSAGGRESTAPQGLSICQGHHGDRPRIQRWRKGDSGPAAGCERYPGPQSGFTYTEISNLLFSHTDIIPLNIRQKQGSMRSCTYLAHTVHHADRFGLLGSVIQNHQTSGVVFNARPVLRR